MSSADQRADDAAGLGAHQLGRVGVALLRHDRAAGGEARPTGATKPNCGDRPDHELLGQAATGAWRRSTAAARNSSAKSRSETASSELAVGRSKPSACGRHVPVDREAACRPAPPRRAGIRSCARARRRSGRGRGRTSRHRPCR